MEENTDITYIPFGADGQIEETPLMEALANNVNAYVESKPWSKKKKQRFMDAYSAIMQRGLVGASVRDGQWYVDYNGDPISYANKKDQDMYEQAAYYIKSQMQGLATSQKDKKDKEDADAPLFGNAYLNEQFAKHLANQEFGGRQFTTEEWNEFDERGANGLRGIRNRAEILARNLQSFSDSLKEDGKYSFKDSPYRDLKDVKERIQNAITALRTPDPNDDSGALNKLGINPKLFFYDGGEDKMTAEDGTEMTVNDYYTKYKPALDKAAAEKAAAEAKQKQAAAAAKQAQLRQTQFSSLKFYTPKGFTGTFADWQRKYAGKEFGKLFSSLATQGLNSEQSADLITFFKEAERTGQLSQLSDTEKQAFGRFNNLVGRLRKFEGLNGFYWDIAAKRVVQPSAKNGQSILTGSNSSLLNPPSEEETEAAEREAANQRQVFRNLETEDVARLTAIAADFTGLLASFAPTIGTAVAAGTGLTSLGANLVADIADKSVTKSQVFWNTLSNLGLGVVSLLPGGGLSKLTKILKTGATYLPLLMGVANSYQDRALIESAFKKWNHPKDITNEELKAVAYAMTTLAGGARAGRGFVNERKYGPAFGQRTKVQQAEVYNTKTKKVERVTVDADKAKRLNSAKPKTKKEADSIIKEVVGTDYVAPSTFKPASKINPLSKPLATKSEVTYSEGNAEYRAALEAENAEYRRTHNGHIRTDYEIYAGEKPYLRSKLRERLPSWLNISLGERLRSITENPYKKWQREHAPEPAATETAAPAAETGTKSSKEKPKTPEKPEKNEKNESWEEFRAAMGIRKRGKNGKYEVDEHGKPVYEKAPVFSSNESSEIKALDLPKGFGRIERIAVPTSATSNGIEVRFIGKDGKSYSATGKTTLELKQATLEMMKKAMRDFDKLDAKNKSNSIKYDLIKQLKNEGFLKQGGKLTSRQILENFYKTL